MSYIPCHPCKLEERHEESQYQAFLYPLKWFITPLFCHRMPCISQGLLQDHFLLSDELDCDYYLASGKRLFTRSKVK